MAFSSEILKTFDSILFKWVCTVKIISEATGPMKTEVGLKICQCTKCFKLQNHIP